MLTPISAQTQKYIRKFRYNFLNPLLNKQVEFIRKSLTLQESIAMQIHQKIGNYTSKIIIKKRYI